jgi:hypothetical protein
VRTLKMRWNSGTSPLACHWVESEDRKSSLEWLARLEGSKTTSGTGHQASLLQPAKLDWDLFWNFRTPAFPPSFGH